MTPTGQSRHHAERRICGPICSFTDWCWKAVDCFQWSLSTKSMGTASSWILHCYRCCSYRARHWSREHPIYRRERYMIFCLLTCHIAMLSKGSIWSFGVLLTDWRSLVRVAFRLSIIGQEQDNLGDRVSKCSHEWAMQTHCRYSRGSLIRRYWPTAKLRQLTIFRATDFYFFMDHLSCLFEYLNNSHDCFATS